MDDFDGFDFGDLDIDPVSIVAKAALKAAVKTAVKMGTEALRNMNHEETTVISKEITIEEAKSFGIIDEEEHVITKECTIEELLRLGRTDE